MSEYRIEKDSMGEVKVPARAYYGAQTQRAVDNFPISGQPLPKALIRALGLVKIAAAIANRDLGKLKPELADPIVRAAREVAEGKLDDQFPVDVYQTGSGTSSNMNANEVISNRAIEMAGRRSLRQEEADPPQRSRQHGAIDQRHVSDRDPRRRRRWPSNEAIDTGLRSFFGTSCRQGEGVGRHHQDRPHASGRCHADPPGQEISGYVRQLERCRSIRPGKAFMRDPRIARRRHRGGHRHQHASEIRRQGGRRCWPRRPAFAFVEAKNHFEANANRDGLVECSGQLRAIAVTPVQSIANNIRWLGSGPRCGFYEIMLPDLQPGSSIMPGKVNPVMCESMMQVCARVLGNDQTIAFAGATGGQFELNIMMPVMGLAAILESIQLLASRAPMPSSNFAPWRWKRIAPPARSRSSGRWPW